MTRWSSYDGVDDNDNDGGDEDKDDFDDNDSGNGPWKNIRFHNSEYNQLNEII